MSEPMSYKDAETFFSYFFKGTHHVPSSGIKRLGIGWYVNMFGELSTYDGDDLTRLVLMAHKLAIRVNIRSGGPSKLIISIWKRKREGRLHELHPTIEQAIEESKI